MDLLLFSKLAMDLDLLRALKLNLDLDLLALGPCNRQSLALL